MDIDVDRELLNFLDKNFIPLNVNVISHPRQLEEANDLAQIDHYLLKLILLLEFIHLKLTY